MEKKGLFLLFIFFLLVLVTGCKTEFDNNNTKLVNLSFNKPVGYRDSRYPIGDIDEKREYEMRVYEFGNYSISITWRENDTFKKFHKGSDVKYENKTLNDKKYKYNEGDNYINYISEHMGDLYIFEFKGEKTEENVNEFKDLLNSAKYRE